MKFTTTLLLGGKTATGIRVPDEVMAALGGSKRIPVSVTINGTRYASTIATMRGEPMIPVSAEIRSAAGIAAGDNITVELEPDDAPRTVDLPADLARPCAPTLRHPSASAPCPTPISGGTCSPSPEHAPPKPVPSASSACSTNFAQADTPNRADEPRRGEPYRYLPGAAPPAQTHGLECASAVERATGDRPAGPARRCTT